MQLVIHIGLEKSGTTAIQGFCAANRRRLRENGICYPTSVGERNQTALTLMALEPAPLHNLHRSRRLFDEADVERFRRKTTEELERELSGSSAEVAFFSNEHLSSHLDDEGVARFARWVKRFADGIRVLVYLRRQDEMHLSWYSTQCVGGRAEAFRWPDEDEIARLYDHLGVLRRWGRHFGDENLIVRLYPAASLGGGDVVSDLANVIGVEIDDDWADGGESNARLSVETLDFLWRYNRDVGYFLSFGPDPLRGPIIDALSSAPGPSTRLVVASKAARAFLSRFDSDNRIIAREYLGREEGGLYPEPVGIDDTTDMDRLDTDQAVQIASHLWKYQQERLIRERRENQRLRQELIDLRIASLGAGSANDG